MDDKKDNDIYVTKKEFYLIVFVIFLSLAILWLIQNTEGLSKYIVVSLHFSLILIFFVRYQRIKSGDLT